MKTVEAHADERVLVEPGHALWFACARHRERWAVGKQLSAAEYMAAIERAKRAPIGG